MSSAAKKSLLGQEAIQKPALPVFSRAVRAALWIFLGLLAYMPVHILLSTWIGTTFGVLEIAKAAKDVVLVLGFLLVLLPSLNKPWFKQYLRDKLLWLIVAYSALTVFMAIVKPTDQDAEILAVVYNLRFLVFFVYGWLLTKFFKPDWLQQKAVKIVLFVAAGVMLFGAVQYFLLPDDALKHVGYLRENGVLPAFFIDDKPDLERVMSTIRDPNSFGSYVLIIMAFALVYLIKVKNTDLKKVLAGLLALSVLCLWFSFSRGAWIGAVATVLVAVWLIYRQKGRIKVNKYLVAAVAAALLVTLGGFYVARDTYFVKNIILHADESTVLEDPNQLRLRFWQESIDAAADNPLGYGPGTAGLPSVRNEVQGTILNENYYFQILHEVGVIGLVLFIAIIIVVALRLLALSAGNPYTTALLASFAGLFITNLLVHIWANEAVAYTWWGLAGLLLAKGYIRPQSS